MSGTLAGFIATRRRALGLDQTALAAAVGVGQQTISRWESSVGGPRRQHVPALARALKADTTEVHALAGYTPDSTATPVDELVVAIRRLAHGMTDRQLLDVIDVAWTTHRARTLTAAP